MTAEYGTDMKPRQQYALPRSRIPSMPETPVRSNEDTRDLLSPDWRTFFRRAGASPSRCSDRLALEFRSQDFLKFQSTRFLQGFRRRFIEEKQMAAGIFQRGDRAYLRSRDFHARLCLLAR